MKNTVKMFTYGTLKDVEYLKMKGATNIIENAYVTGYKLYSNKGLFPVTKATGKNSDVIYGTLFTIPIGVILDVFDPIEGYHSKGDRVDNLYNRVKEVIQIPDSDKDVLAYMYVANENWFRDIYTEANLIKSGKWEDAKRRVAPYEIR